MVDDTRSALDQILYATPPTPSAPAIKPADTPAVAKFLAIQGRPEWGDESIPAEQRQQDLLRTHAVAGSTHEELDAAVQQHLPNADLGRAHQEFGLESARQKFADKEESAGNYLTRHVLPGVSSGKAIGWPLRVARAQDAYQKGEARPDQLETLAEDEWLRRKDEQYKKREGFLTAAGHTAAGILPIVAEMAAGGGGKAAGWLAGKAAGEAAPSVLGRAAAAGLTLPLTVPALSPLQGAAQRVQQQGGDLLAVKNLGPAWGESALKATVLGAVQSQFAGLPGLVPRSALQGTVGAGEMMLADYAAGTLGLSHGKGEVYDDMVKGKYGDAARSFAVNAIAFAGFAAAHGRQESSKPLTKEQIVEKAKELADAGAKPGPDGTVRLPDAPPDQPGELFERYAKFRDQGLDQDAALRAAMKGTAEKPIDTTTQDVEDLLGGKTTAADLAKRGQQSLVDQAVILSRIRKTAYEADLQDSMRELEGVHPEQRGIPDEVTRRFDAHGTATLETLTDLLNKGVDPTRPFFSSQLPASGAIGVDVSGMGTMVRGNSHFIVLGHPGKSIREGGIGMVLVDPLHSPGIPDLQRAFPNVKFVAAKDAGTVLEKTSRGAPEVDYRRGGTAPTAPPEGQPAPNPLGTHPKPPNAPEAKPGVKPTVAPPGEPVAGTGSVATPAVPTEPRARLQHFEGLRDASDVRLENALRAAKAARERGHLLHATEPEIAAVKATDKELAAARRERKGIQTELDAVRDEVMKLPESAGRNIAPPAPVEAPTEKPPGSPRTSPESPEANTPTRPEIVEPAKPQRPLSLRERIGRLVAAAAETRDPLAGPLHDVVKDAGLSGRVNDALSSDVRAALDYPSDQAGKSLRLMVDHLPDQNALHINFEYRDKNGGLVDVNKGMPSAVGLTLFRDLVKIAERAKQGGLDIQFKAEPKRAGLYHRGLRKAGYEKVVEKETGPEEMHLKEYVYKPTKPTPAGGKVTAPKSALPEPPKPAHPEAETGGREQLRRLMDESGLTDKQKLLIELRLHGEELPSFETLTRHPELRNEGDEPYTRQNLQKMERAALAKMAERFGGKDVPTIAALRKWSLAADRPVVAEPKTEEPAGSEGAFARQRAAEAAEDAALLAEWKKTDPKGAAAFEAMFNLRKKQVEAHDEIVDKEYADELGQYERASGRKLSAPLRRELLENIRRRAQARAAADAGQGNAGLPANQAAPGQSAVGGAGGADPAAGPPAAAKRGPAAGGVGRNIAPPNPFLAGPTQPGSPGVTGLPAPPPTGATERGGVPGRAGPIGVGETNPPQEFALARERVTEERGQRDLPPVVKAASRDNPTGFAHATAELARNPEAGRDLVERLERDPQSLRLDDDVPMLLLHRVALSNKHDAAQRAFNEQVGRYTMRDGKLEPVAAASLEPLRRQAEDALAERNRLDEVTNKVGSLIGRGLQYFKQLAKEDYSLGGMLGAARFAKGGKPLTPEETKTVTDHHEQVTAADTRLREAEAAALLTTTEPAAKPGFFTRAARWLQTLFAPPERVAPRSKAWDFADQMEKSALAELDAKLGVGGGKLFAGFDPTLIVPIAKYAAAKIIKGGLTFADFSKGMIAKFGPSAQPHLDATWKAAELFVRAAEKAAAPAGKPGDLTDLRVRSRKARSDYGDELAKIKLAEQTTSERAFGAVRDAANASRSLVTSMDLSAALRQGGVYSAGHPLRATGFLAKSIHAALSERAYDRQMEQLRENPNYELAVRSKMYLADTAGPLTRGEEAFMSRWFRSKVTAEGGARLLPHNLLRLGVQASERAYNSFLNHARMDMFGTMAATMARGGRPTAEEARVLANAVNVSTGRGPLGPAEKVARQLSDVFFSPRYWASRIQLLVGQPFYHGTAATRKAIAIEYARAAMGLGMFYAIAAALSDDAKFQWNPRSSDFGKVQYGKSRVDPLTGLSQNMVFGTRLVTGQTKSTQTGEVKDLYGPNKPFGGTSMMDIAGRYVRGKFAPALGVATDVVMRDTLSPGEKPTLKREAGQALLPISFRDVYDAMKEQGMPRGAAIGILSVLGMGSQVHDNKKTP